MVKVIDHQKRTTDDGKEFQVLILQGGIEVVKSKVSGKPYITARKANMVCTLDEKACQSLIGTELPGSIIKVACAPYDYTLPQSKEVVQLDYTYSYSEEAVNPEEAVFS